MEVDISPLVVRAMGAYPALRFFPWVVAGATIQVLSGMKPEYWHELDSELGSTAIAGTSWALMQGRDINSDGGG